MVSIEMDGRLYNALSLLLDYSLRGLCALEGHLERGCPDNIISLFWIHDSCIMLAAIETHHN